MTEELKRVHKLNDGSEVIQKVWTSDYGLTFWCPEKSCVFCKHCHDIWYDSSGPYMFGCKKETGNQTALGYEGKCNLFEKDEAVDQRSEKNREARRKAEELMENEELREYFSKAMGDYFDDLFRGLTDIRDFEV